MEGRRFRDLTWRTHDGSGITSPQTMKSGRVPVSSIAFKIAMNSQGWPMQSLNPTGLPSASCARGCMALTYVTMSPAWVVMKTRSTLNPAIGAPGVVLFSVAATWLNMSQRRPSS